MKATGPIAVIIVGVTGNGISSFVSAHFGDSVYVSFEDIRAELDRQSRGLRRQRGSFLSARKTFFDYIEVTLQSGRNVVVDPPVTRPAGRRELIAFCRKAGAREIVALWLKSSVDVWAQNIEQAYGAWEDRPSPKAIAYMWWETEKDPPSRDEGFSSVFEVPVS